MVRYYGYYNNVSPGRRKKSGVDEIMPCPRPSLGGKPDIQCSIVSRMLF